MTQPIRREGIIIFSMEHTLFTPQMRTNVRDGVRFSRVENGIRVLKSCVGINHFAAIVANAGESMRDRLTKLIQKQTGMEPEVDFGLYLIPEKDGKPEANATEHFTKVVTNWVEYCAKQQTRVTAGVSSDAAFLDILRGFEIRTCKCDLDFTEVEEFRKLTPEEIEENNRLLEAGKEPANGGLQQMQEIADADLIDEDDNGDALDGFDESSKLPIIRGDDQPETPAEGRDTRRRNDPSPDWQSDPIFEGDPAIEQAIQFPQYWKRLPTNWEFVDVYRVDELFPIELPGSSRLYHARKKLMVPGTRTGGKPAYKDIQEAVATLQGWLRDHEPRSDA